MKTLISFFNGKTEKASINEFQNSALSFNVMGKVRGGDGDPTTDIWLPDEDDKK